MAKKTKVAKEPKEATPEKSNSTAEALALLIDMETNNLQSMLSMRNQMTGLCEQSRNSLVLFGKMTGVDTGLLESLKI